MTKPEPKYPREFTVQATEHLQHGLKRSVTLHLTAAGGQLQLFHISGEGVPEIDASQREEQPK